MEKLNVDALFLGPKSENELFFKEMLHYLIDDFMEWRKGYHSEDHPAITADDQIQTSFQQTLLDTRLALVELAGRLQDKSMPWFSTRYLGHMTTDTLMAANLGYMLTLLYNPNNCAYEGSPVTTEMELEVGKRLAVFLGYDPERSWGHIASGGTIANYEGLWLARNLKAFPLAVAEIEPDWVQGLDTWQLLNLPSERILDLVEKAIRSNRFAAIRSASAGQKGLAAFKPGKVLVPQSKHYSWLKAVDILGIGQENLIFIPVTDEYRMDTGVLSRKLAELQQQKEHVLAVVGIIGTTEEGAVDDIHRIVEIRKAFEQKGLSFYFHIDAAYGGFVRSLYLNTDFSFSSQTELQQNLQNLNLMDARLEYPSEEVYRAFAAMPEADSITIDPHKMGYIPYATGAIAVKDKRILDLISFFAHYVFEKKEVHPLLGSYIMEGSKAGATVAAVWTALQVIPLHQRGYGQIVARGIEKALQLYHALENSHPIDTGQHRYIVRALTKPDINIVDFAFCEIGDTNLEHMNSLNQTLFEFFSYKTGRIYTNDFITSKTSLDQENYGDIPEHFTRRFGIPQSEWERVGSVYVLRSCIMTPFLNSNQPFDEFFSRFMNIMKEKLSAITQKNE